jgi:hypothetical protein
MHVIILIIGMNTHIIFSSLYKNSSCFIFVHIFIYDLIHVL